MVGDSSSEYLLVWPSGGDGGWMGWKVIADKSLMDSEVEKVVKKPNGGCAFGRESRVMIENITEGIKRIETTVNNHVNALSKRLPIWATIIIGFFSAATVGLLVALFKG